MPLKSQQFPLNPIKVQEKKNINHSTNLHKKKKKKPSINIPWVSPGGSPPPLAAPMVRSRPSCWDALIHPRIEDSADCWYTSDRGPRIADGRWLDAGITNCDFPGNHQKQSTLIHMYVYGGMCVYIYMWIYTWTPVCLYTCMHIWI